MVVMSDLYDNTTEASETDTTTATTVVTDDTTVMGADPFEPVSLDPSDDSDPFEPTEVQRSETFNY